MRKVKLIVATGEFVTDVIVPPFQLMPDVLIWGTRVFIREGSARDADTYREGFAVVCWTEQELRNMGMLRN